MYFVYNKYTKSKSKKITWFRVSNVETVPACTLRSVGEEFKWKGPWRQFLI